MKCRPAVGAATEPRSRGVDRLVALAVGGRVGAVDVGRQRDVAVALEGGVGVEAVEEKAYAAQGRRRLATGPRLPRPARGSRARRRRRRPPAGAGPDAPARPRGRARGAARAGSRPRRRPTGGREAGPGKTRLRFVTSRSPGRRSSGRSAKARCSSAPVRRSSTSSREASRCARGCLGDELRGEREVVRADVVPQRVDRRSVGIRPRGPRGSE